MPRPEAPLRAWRGFFSELLEVFPSGAGRLSWSIENSWHWPRDTRLKEDSHRYREPNGVQILATLRSRAMNALRLDGFWSIAEGLAAPAHDSRGLLELLGWKAAAQAISSA